MAAGENSGLPRAARDAARQSGLNNGKRSISAGRSQNSKRCHNTQTETIRNSPWHKSEDANSKSSSKSKTATIPNDGRSEELCCPECGSTRLYRDGLRCLADGSTVQRWLCRNCGFRFSQSTANLNVKRDIARQVVKQPYSREDLSQTDILEIDASIKPALKDLTLQRRENVGSHSSSLVTVSEKGLNAFRVYNSDCRVGVSEGEAKNLAISKTRQIEAQRESTATSQADGKGKIVDFLWWMQKEGYKESTIVSRASRLRRLVKLGADLFNPESVKEVIARQKSWSISRKEAMVWTYDLWAKWLGITWEKPNYEPVRKLPFIPLESEIDDLIASCNKYVAAFLQLAKETGARAGEIYSLKWIDIDFENRTVNITPEKGSDPRVFKISNKVAAMLNTLPREHEQVFKHYGNLNYLRRSFDRYRKRTAHKFGNPRILRITFHTLRHWKGTMEYHKTKDILHVMKLLGHRNIKNTLLYTQLVKLNDNEDEYVSKVARTIDEARSLVETGFEYVCEIEGVKLFRKRK